jgi:carbon starvation protein
MNRLMARLLLLLCAGVGCTALVVVASHRGEPLSSAWLVVAAAGCMLAAYFTYGRLVAYGVLGVDKSRPTPAIRLNDGHDYVPTEPVVLFGHHFAAIAGAGPLVGPVLAAQMGYVPGALWIIIGVILGGAVQDMVVLFASVRHDGHSLGELARHELGRLGGLIASVAVLIIMVILIAVLALVVVNALRGSPWGTVTLLLTIPIALLMGCYLRFIRPGAVLEASLAGLAFLLGALWVGKIAAEAPWGQVFSFHAEPLAWALMAYALLASVLPVWLLLAPRDYLSTFLKIGFIFFLAVLILVVQPDLAMPAVSRFVHGHGPVFAGNLFPFLFITIACGAISGFHALVASGTTPKMILRETHILPIGYGAMLAEGFVAIMALVAACALHPGLYFALNAPAAVLGTTPGSAATALSSLGFIVTPEQLEGAARSIGEASILSRTGGAPTLAMGIAAIAGQAFGDHLLAFWYHFAVLFEAVFILTTLDAGTRVGRFMLEDMFRHTHERTSTSRKSVWHGPVAALLFVGMWGYFLIQGVRDPLGGINTLWPLFGLANQLLAAVALLVVTLLLRRMGRRWAVAVTAAPLLWLLVVTLSAGFQKLFSSDPQVGFLAHAGMVRQLQPAHAVQLIGNDLVNAGLCAVLLACALALVAMAWPKMTTRQCMDRAAAS